MRNGQIATAVGIVVALMQLSCRNSAPTTSVVIDGWWNSDFANGTCQSAQTFVRENRDLIRQMGCAAVTACPETMEIAAACVTDPIASVRSFELAVTSQMASNPDCAGLIVVRFAGANSPPDKQVQKAESGDWWMLGFDYTPGNPRQKWWLSHHGAATYVEGTANSSSVAANVCTVVKGKGASLAN